MPPTDMPDADKTARDGHEKKLMIFSLRLIGEVLATISMPIIALSWIGRRLDVRMATKRPYLLAVGILVAFLVSSVVLCIKSLKYRQQYELLTEKPAGDDPERARPPPASDAMS